MESAEEDRVVGRDEGTQARRHEGVVEESGGEWGAEWVRSEMELDGGSMVRWYGNNSIYIFSTSR